MARIVVAGAGAVGASIAYHLALRGADDVVLADRGEIAGGATGKAMGGVRQQFTTEAEVRLAQASVRLFEELGAPLFEQVGYLFLATTEAGLGELEERRALQASFGVPVAAVDPALVDGPPRRRRARRDDLPRGRDRRPGGSHPRARPARRRARGRGARADGCALARGRDARARLRRLLARGGSRARDRAARSPARAPARRRRAGGTAAPRPADDDRGERLPLPSGRCRAAQARHGGAAAPLGRPGRGARGPRRGLARPARLPLSPRGRRAGADGRGRASTT